MTPFNPPQCGNQSDSIDHALQVYSALCEVAVASPNVGRDSLMVKARAVALDRLLMLSEAI